MLEAIVERVKSAEIKGQDLVVHFRNQKDPWVAGPPAAPGKYKGYPASFAAIVAHHERMSFGEKLRFGELHMLDFGMYDEGDNVYELFGGDAEKVKSPLVDSISNYTVWVYDPEEKNAQGETAIFPVIHEMEDEIDHVQLNAGALFLERMNEKAGWKIPMPRATAPKQTTTKQGDWWNGLDPNWQRIFRVACEFPRGKVHDTEPTEPVTLEKVLAAHIRGLNCLGLPITDLSPLAALDGKKFSPELVFLENTKVTDVSSLARFKKLFSVDISGTPVADVSSLKQIRYLDADGCDKLDLASIAKLSNLKSLSLRKTGCSDLRPFSKLKELQELQVLDTPITDAQVRAFLKDRKVKLDLRPDIADPLQRTLTERASYEPERALEAGDQLLARLKKGKQRDLVLEQMAELAAAAEGRYLYSDRERFHRFSAHAARYGYMRRSGDLSPRRSVKDASAKEVAQLMLSVYKKKEIYDEANLERAAFFSAELFVRHLTASSFHDISLKDVEKAAVDSGLFAYKKSDGTMYVKPKGK